MALSLSRLCKFNTGLVVLLSFIVSACSSNDFAKTGEKENKSQTFTTPSLDGQPKVATPFARVIYAIQVKSNTGGNTILCDGAASFILYDNFEMKPSGSITCLMAGNVSLQNLFGSPDVQQKSEDLSGLKEFGRIQRKQNPVQMVPGTATFTPPQPRFIGPVVQNDNEFIDFVFNEPSQVQGIGKDGKPFSGTGEWFFRVHELIKDYHPENYTGAMTFPNVFRWEMKGAGFEGTPRSSFMAFDSMMYWMNTKPQIAIPRIEIKTKLSEVTGNLNGGAASGGVMGSLGDAIFGGVTIVLTIKEHTPL